jgi:large subunit ribosomal protein L9
MIEVILLERIERLGPMGQVVKVRPGFARNYLLPQKKALRATKANLELFEKQRAQLEAKNTAERGKAQASETGQLYGSVSARDVAEAAKEAKRDIHRAQVQIDQPIKALGLFPVKVKLHPEIAIKVTINVARSPEEAEVQERTGAALTQQAAEKAGVIAAFGAPAEAKGEEGKKAAPKKRASKKEAKLEEEEAEAKPAKEAKPKTAKARHEEDEPKAKSKAKAKK